MTTKTACRNCGQPSVGPYCAAHELTVCRVCGGPPLANHAGVPQLRDGLCQGCWPEQHDTASRRVPAPGALAPSERYYRLNALQLSWLCRDLIERYDVLRETRPVVAAQRAISEALDTLAPFAELSPPLRRTPAGGVATLDGVITQASQHQREAYAPAGMTACCVVCTPVSWWLTAASRDAHAAEQHPLPDHPPP